MARNAYGKIAFEAYAKAVGGTTHDGKVIPDWADLGDRVRGAWEAAGAAVAEEIDFAARYGDQPESEDV